MEIARDADALAAHAAAALQHDTLADVQVHVGTFNRVNLAAHRAGLVEDFVAVAPVASWRRKSADAVRAKLLEVSQRASTLAATVRSGARPDPPATRPAAAAEATVMGLFERFHAAILSPTPRAGRGPLLRAPRDEYDVQALLGMFLRCEFNDVRAEEWTPSYAGGSARIDYLLPEERVAIETKMTRPSLLEKRVADELIVDVARYRQHAACRTLACLVYDPDHRIRNPRGLEADLEKLTSRRLRVRVAVRP